MTTLQRITAEWVGIRPLIVHNGRLADPLDKYVKKIKALTKGNKGANKTEAKDAEISRLEWEGSMYWDEKLGPVIPSDNVERCIQLGAQKSKLGKQVQAGVFCTEECVSIPIKYDGPRSLAAMYEDKRFSLRKGVCVAQSRVMRVRPMFPTGWRIEFTIEFDESVVEREAVIRSMQDAGSLIGLGDWRPKFGRFIVNIVEA